MKGDRATINAWAMYDWANSAYSLIINAAIFPIYYETVTNIHGSDKVSFLGGCFINTALYSWAIAFAFLFTACLSPFLSGIADYRGNKRTFMQFFCYLGSLACSSMFLFTPDRVWLGILLAILACIGHSGSLVFYNAFLPEIAAEGEQDAVSARGFALGYIGSTILLLFNLSLFYKPDWYGTVSSGMAARISFATVGIWWISFAQITFHYLKNSPRGGALNRDIILSGYRELLQVFHKAMRMERLRRYLPAFFVYNMGVQTVILIATLFGKKEMGMESAQLMWIVLYIQILATFGAYLFSLLSSELGNIATLKIATLAWAAICSAAYFIQTVPQFHIVAMLVGLVMGGIQSLSRSTYSKMLPANEPHASFFSFYDFCEKIGIVLGMGIFGIVNTATNSLRAPTISLVVFFILGFLLLMKIPKEKYG